jgi:Holliday junction resolvasome RuvABC endonuclease subunit
LDKKFYIGIDLSTTSTGVVIIRKEDAYLDYYLITPNKAKCLEDRVVDTLKMLQDVFEDYSDKNIKVCIESSALYGKGKRNELAMLNGAVYYYLLLKDIDVTLVPPSRLKKFATGNGRADKSDMLSATPKTIGVLFQSKFKKYDDLVDAYWLAKHSIYIDES